MIKSYFCKNCQEIHFGDLTYEITNVDKNIIITDKNIQSAYRCEKCGTLAPEIDMGLVYPVAQLNGLGYTTTFCCEGAS